MAKLDTVRWGRTIFPRTLSSLVQRPNGKSVESAIEELEKSSGGSGGGISDAPSDGKKYVRQNQKWVEETSVDVTSLQPKSDNSLGTTSKTVVGAINEINTNVANNVLKKLIKSVSLTKGADGVITGGTVTLQDNTTIPITVTDAP